MNKHIDNIVKSIGRHKKGLRDPQIMHPEREWSIGIFLAILIFVSSAAWSLALYIENRNVTVEVSEEAEAESVVYRESMVEEALVRLKERGTTLASLLPRESDVPVEEVVEDVTEEVATSSESTTPLLEEVTEVEPVEVEQTIQIE